MPTKTEKDWADIAFESWQLGIEAWPVIGLRSARLMGGGSAACSEARLMVTEKIDAGRELSGALATGAFGNTPKAMLGNTVTFYLDGVRKNRKRLSKR